MTAFFGAFCGAIVGLLLLGGIGIATDNKNK